jgi:hypothetical protein
MFRHLVLTRTFGADQFALDAYNQRHLGQREVPLAAIVGTVGRGSMGDTRRTRRWTKSTRYSLLRTALERGIILPPVDLYLLAGHYYILDGHHRVAIARESGALEIDATVIEFLPRAEPAAIWHRGRATFERDTGLLGLHIRQQDGYARLRHQIAAHRGKLLAQRDAPPTFAAAAADWARTIYQPVVTELTRRGVRDRSPELTVTELFLAFYDYAIAHGGLQSCGCDTVAAVAAYARSRRLPWLAHLSNLFTHGKIQAAHHRCVNSIS